MHIRLYRPTDYALFCRWNAGHGLDPLPAAALPKTGFIVVKGDRDLAMAFLYRTDSALCHIEWVTRDPSATREEMDGVIEFLVDSLCSFAAKAGFALAWMSTRHDGLIARLQTIGWSAPERGTMTNLIRVLEGGAPCATSAKESRAL